MGNFKETQKCTPNTKWGVVSLKAPSEGIFHSSSVLTAAQVKNQYCCAWLVYPLGVYNQLSQAKDGVLVLFTSYITFATPL